MPEVEKLSVKIEADASSLKKESNESVSALERLKSAFTDLKAKLHVPVKLNTSQYTAQIAHLENQIADLTSMIEAKGAKEMFGSDAILKAQARVEQLNNQLEDLKRKQNEINGN